MDTAIQMSLVRSIALMGFTIASINAVIILPIIFNFFIVPGIEKKLEHKLELTASIYTNNGFPWLARRFFKYLDVATYIVLYYAFGTRVQKALLDYGERLRLSSLCKVHYDMALASKMEIILSFLAYLNIVLFMTSGLLLMIYHH